MPLDGTEKSTHKESGLISRLPELGETLIAVATTPNKVHFTQQRNIHILEPTGHIAEVLPDDIKKDLEKACALHDRAVSDYAKCEEFSKLMSDLLSRLEDVGCFKTADKVMSILLDCNPKIGAHCEKSTIVSQVTKKLG